MASAAGEGDGPGDRASRAAISPDLLQYDEVWAAAGTSHDVVGSESHPLVEVRNGLVTDPTRN